MKRSWMKVLFAVLALFFLSGLSAAGARAERKIGILLWNDQPRYVNNKSGVMDYLNRHGVREPRSRFVVESACGNKTKAVGVARRFAAERMDLVVTIGTTATVIAANEIKDIPIVFVMVWDPVESKVAKGWQSSGNNTTGVSSKTPASKLLSAIKEFSGAKRVAVLYTPGERNSVIQLREFEKEQEALKMDIVPVLLGNKEMAEPVLSDVVTKVDAVCLTGSSVIGDELPMITEMATRAGVVTASQSEDHVERGALLGITVDSYAIGQLAGEKALKILNGAKPSSIPIEPLKRTDLIINMKTARAGRFRIVPRFMKSVTRVVE